MVRRRIHPTFDSWRDAARELLQQGVPPGAISWDTETAESTSLRLSLPEEAESEGRGTSVPARFLSLAAAVACHRSGDRWDLLYRILWRLTGNEPHLLDIVTDPAVHDLLLRASAVRRSSHKMKAFVRFRETIGEDGDPVYIAWFEPAHLVVPRTAPFFARRFASMRWQILTPDCCVSWDRQGLRFSSGMSPQQPTESEIEALWRTYYSHIFNPARVKLGMMQKEMPRFYWKNLPEAQSIAHLVRSAPRRVAAMLEQISADPEELPAELRATEPTGVTPSLSPSPTAGPLDAPGEDPRHDPGLEAALNRDRGVGEQEAVRPGLGSGHALVGVAGWTDPTLTRSGVFYPAGVHSAADRLRFYASRFPVVEVDATYYSFPSRSTVQDWAARTPDNFQFHVKANGLMTGHGVERTRLPDWLARELTPSSRGKVYGHDLPLPLQQEVWARFLAALEPLRRCGKLVSLLLQYPRWFEPCGKTFRALECARAWLGPDLGAVEFRHRDWATGVHNSKAVAALKDLGLAYVNVDAPPGTVSSMPWTTHTTVPGTAFFRFHGRRTVRWEAVNNPATERYRYLYDEDELTESVRRIIEASERLVHLYITFNNCHGNYATTNAREFTSLLLAR